MHSLPIWNGSTARPVVWSACGPWRSTGDARRSGLSTFAAPGREGTRHHANARQRAVPSPSPPVWLRNRSLTNTDQSIGKNRARLWIDPLIHPFTDRLFSQGDQRIRRHRRCLRCVDPGWRVWLVGRPAAKAPEPTECGSIAEVCRLGYRPVIGFVAHEGVRVKGCAGGKRPA